MIKLIKSVVVARVDDPSTLIGVPRIRWLLGPLCLASLGLEGIRSSSFTFDSLAGHN